MILFVLVSVLATVHAGSYRCVDMEKTGLPCVEIPSCSGAFNAGVIKINKLTTGVTSKSHSVANLCYTSNELRVTVNSMGQTIFPQTTQFSLCNDPIYNMDVVELFIAPRGMSDPKWYSEIDTNPYNVMFESGIYNPNLNHTGISNYLMDCSTSQITHKTNVDKSSSSWSWTVTVPWHVVNNPQGRTGQSEDNTPAIAGDVFRGNVYRINELVNAAPSCSSKTCEYMNWSPTMTSTPAFHEPTKFGYLILV